MNKKKASVIRAMKLGWTMEESVSAWNKFKKYVNDKYKNDDFSHIFKMEDFDEDHKSLKPTEIVAHVTGGRTTQGPLFRNTDKYYVKHGTGYYSFNSFLDPCCPIGYNWLAEHLLENGDCGFPEVDNTYLVEDFIAKYYPAMKGDKKFFRKVMDSDNDFLMDDWDDIYDDIESIA